MKMRFFGTKTKCSLSLGARCSVGRQLTAVDEVHEVKGPKNDFTAFAKEQRCYSLGNKSERYVSSMKPAFKLNLYGGEEKRADFSSN